MTIDVLTIHDDASQTLETVEVAADFFNPLPEGNGDAQAFEKA